MWTAALWGGIAGSAVFIGALIGILFTIEKRWIGLIMAFGTGVLIGAAAFELLKDSISRGGVLPTSIGFICGAGLFTTVDYLISRKGGHERKRSRKNPEHSSGLAIFIGTILDAIPESVIIGVSIVGKETVSWLLVIAIFISNLPEGLSSSVGLKQDGYSNIKILLLWSGVLVLSALSAFAGFIFFKSASATIIASIAAFAAGGVVAMVSSTMMPEAYEEGGPIVGFVTALGLLSSLILSRIS